MMADGGETGDRWATRRELDREAQHLQRQIDDHRRMADEKMRDIRDEVRRLGESIQQGMAMLAQKLERKDPPPPPPAPPPAPLPTQLYNDAKKSGTPMWVIVAMLIGALFLYLIAKKMGVM